MASPSDCYDCESQIILEQKAIRTARSEESGLAPHSPRRSATTSRSSTTTTASAPSSFVSSRQSSRRRTGGYNRAPDFHHRADKSRTRFAAAMANVGMNGPEDDWLDWSAKHWRAAEHEVRRLRQRFFKASQASDHDHGSPDSSARRLPGQADVGGWRRRVCSRNATRGRDQSLTTEYCPSRYETS